MKRNVSGEPVPYISLGLPARAQGGMVLPPLSPAKAERGSRDHSKSFKPVTEAQCTAAQFPPKKSRFQRVGLTPAVEAAKKSSCSCCMGWELRDFPESS